MALKSSCDAVRCGAEIKLVGYEPGQPWPAAKVLGWAIAKGPREKPGWDYRLADQNEPMDVVGDDPPASSGRRR